MDEQSNDWIEWPGGECPVHPDTQVEVKLSGPRQRAHGKAASFMAKDPAWSNWARRGYNDIIAYRVVPA